LFPIVVYITSQALSLHYSPYLINILQALYPCF